MLKAEKLKLIYPGGAGIDSISCEIERGLASVIMGPSGSGKTTLLRALCLLETPQSGILQLDDLKISFPLKEESGFLFPYPKVTLVFQQLFLWPHLSNRKNLELPLTKESQYQKLEVLIKKLELHSFLEKYPNQSSLGQQQRIALARALALSPDYLLLDEATSALDKDLTTCVADLLLDLVDQGLGLLVVTHDQIFADILNVPVLRLENGNFVRKL